MIRNTEFYYHLSIICIFIIALRHVYHIVICSTLDCSILISVSVEFSSLGTFFTTGFESHNSQIDALRDSPI